MISRTDRSIIGLWWWTVDRPLLWSAALLAAAGIFLVMAASPPVALTIKIDPNHFVNRHALFLIPAALVLAVTSVMSHRAIRIIALLGLIATTILIATALITGPEINGAKRWIPLGAIKLQPSEFAKPCFAVVTAWLLSLWREEHNLPGWLISGACLIILAWLLVLQPDIGMTIVIATTWTFQIFLAGMPLALILALVLIVAPASLIIGYTTLPHVHSRINEYLKGGSMQADNAMRSFQNGGVFGVGPGNGEIKYILPDAHSDFIFAVAGEEFGIITCIALAILYAFIMLRSFKLAKNSETLFLIYAIAGLAMQFGLQALIHMASSVQLIPTKGMTLPFISYGGSSLLATALTVGILLALTRRQDARGQTL